MERMGGSKTKNKRLKDQNTTKSQPMERKPNDNTAISLEHTDDKDTQTPTKIYEQEPKTETTNQTGEENTRTQEDQDKNNEEKSLWGKLELIKYNPIQTNPTKWQCNIGICQTRGKTPQNMAKHIARTHKNENVRICRKKHTAHSVTKNTAISMRR